MDKTTNNTDGGATGLKGKKVVWVEDDKFLSDIISRKLVHAGCNLVYTPDGSKAVALIKKELPDVVLLDLLLPGSDGFQILEEIKKKGAPTEHIPVILLTNLGQKVDVERGKRLGAARFLIKATISLDEVTTQIKEVLQENIL